MTKSFNNVKDMIRGLSEDEKFKEEAIYEIENKTIAKFLFIQRCEHKLTQKQLADKTGCSQSRISKIESSYDNEITIKDLLDYGNAFNLQLGIEYRKKDIKIVDLVKYHAFKIKDYLERLVSLAEGDKALSKGVLNFVIESYINLTNMTLKNIPSLNKSLRPTKEEPIHLSAPFENMPKKTKRRKELTKA